MIVPTIDPREVLGTQKLVVLCIRCRGGGEEATPMDGQQKSMLRPCIACHGDGDYTVLIPLAYTLREKADMLMRHPMVGGA